jgi:hypothetical protein
MPGGTAGTAYPAGTKTRTDELSLPTGRWPRSTPRGSSKSTRAGGARPSKSRCTTRPIRPTWR